MRYKTIKYLLLLVGMNIALTASANVAAEDVEIQFTYNDDFYLDCDGSDLSYNVSWEGIVSKSSTALGVTQEAFESGWNFDGNYGDGSILTQYSGKNQLTSQPIGSVYYYDVNGIKGLSWRISADDLAYLMWAGWIQVDNNMGLSTVSITTYLKLQGNPNVWVKLTIPAGKIHFATASINNNKTLSYWYALNRSASGTKEVHANVTVPNTQNDDCAFVWDILAAFDGYTVGGSINNERNFPNLAEEVIPEFFFTTPTTSSPAMNAEFNADSKGQWKVKGNSGAEYTLQVAANQKSVEAIAKNGKTIATTPIVTLVTPDSIPWGMETVESAVMYEQNDVAFDLLNVAGHKELGSLQTFTAYMQIKLVGACYDPIISDGSDYVNVKFLRPVDVKKTNTTEIQEGVNGGSTVNIMDLVSLVDWRDQSFTSSNGITDKGPSSGDDYMMYETPHYINYYEVQLMADVDNATTDINKSEAERDAILENVVDIEKLVNLKDNSPACIFNFTDAPITWNGSKLVGGEIFYSNNSGNVKKYHIYVPIILNYKWGYNIHCGYGVITVINETTPSYTLTISASGNGSVSYSGNSIRNGNSQFAIDEGANATISIAADNGYRVASLKVNNQEVASHSTMTSYTVSNITANTAVSVTFEQIPATTYTLTIQSGSGGYVSYNGTTISNTTKSFSVASGSSATISITPNTGYKLSKLTVNGTNVTSSVSNNQYTISNISANTSVVVTFEQITYTLSVQATGMGVISYNNNSIKNATRTYTVNHGSSATLTITPDNGYRLASMTVNGTNVTSKVSNNQYTISNITANTSVVATFEKIPVTTYSLSIQSGSGGSVTYDGSTITNTTKSFTVTEGASATLTITPNTGYKLSKLTVNGTNVTSSVLSNQYTISNISANTSVVATFEQITYTLSVKVSGSGTVTFNSTSVKNTTRTFSVNHGSSATLTITPDNGYRLASMTVNDTDVTSMVSNNQYVISSITANITVSVTFELIPPITYTLDITASGNGSVTYNGTNTVRNQTKSYTVNEGSDATLSFSPDDGYRLASVKVNSTDVTSKVTNNQYTISNITANITVTVTFTQITYNLNVQATGGGTITYNGTSVKNASQIFTVNHGSSATLTLKPDNGCRLASLAVNGTDVTDKVSNNQYTISDFKATTYVVATFEEIPVTTYTLSIQSGNGGSVSYNGITIANTTKTFTVAEGSSTTITITPDSGFRLSKLTVNGTDMTSKVANNQYTINNITDDVSLVASFEEIPPTTYTLSIQSGSGGSVSYDGMTITNATKSFTVIEGSSATLTILPDNGYRLTSLSVNGTNETSNVSNNLYTISSITANTSVTVSFEKRKQEISQDGINYRVGAFDTNTLNVGSGDYSGHVTIPASVTYEGETWTVVGVADGVFNTPAITAVTWNPAYPIGSGAFGNQTNPNMLLYVKAASYAPSNVQNVIVNGKAKKIVLTDAASGNDFDCPKAFTAEEISFTHNYSMTTGMGECRGWETIALPFDVLTITHETKNGLVPFKAYYKDSPNKPFWLYQLSAAGFIEAEAIMAYTPYIISMPNNDHYDAIYNLSGNVTFAAANVKVDVTKQNSSKSGDKTFVPNFSSQPASEIIFPLNVDNDFFTHRDYYAEGSHFVKGSRAVCPFEAYMTTSSANAVRAISIFEDLPSAIQEIPIVESEGETSVRIFNLNGQQMKPSEDISQKINIESLPRGVYIVNGKKIVVR